MPHVSWTRIASLTILLAASCCVVVPQPSHAFAPPATARVSRFVPDALPPAAHWNAAWDVAVAAQVERILEAEDVDPEAFAPRHRYVSTGASAAISTLAGAMSAEVVGSAPRELADAASRLRVALASRQASRIVETMARLSITAVDLSDPFLVTAPVSSDRFGARARFSDLIGDGDLEGLAATSWIPPADATEAGVALAAQSAVERAPIELAARLGDAEGLDRLRRERLGAAIVLARAIARDSWRAAGSPSLADAEPRNGVARIWPTPTFGAATVSFSLPRAGEARVEIFDLAGRLRWQRELGPRPPGPQEVIVGAGALAPLPVGVYLARVSSSGYHASARILRLGR